MDPNENVPELLQAHVHQRPKLGRKVYIARTAIVMGAVTLGDYSSVWYQAVLRADINRIVIGHHSNIQDAAIVHLAGERPCLLGNYVTVGHAAVVHACTIEDQCLVGMGAVVLDGAVIGRECLIGARALVTPGMRIPEGSLVLGAPAKVARALTPKERAELKCYAEHYVKNSGYCLEHRINVGKPLGPFPARPRAKGRRTA